MNSKAQQALSSCLLDTSYQMSHIPNLNMLNTAFIPLLQTSPIRTSTIITKASIRSPFLMIVCFCFVVDTGLVSGLGWSALCGNQTGSNLQQSSCLSLPSTGITSTHHHIWHCEVSFNCYSLLNLDFTSRIPIYLNGHNPFRVAQHYPGLLF